jgi:hypothetical protein
VKGADAKIARDTLTVQFSSNRQAERRKVNRLAMNSELGRIDPTSIFGSSFQASTGDISSK